MVGSEDQNGIRVRIDTLERNYIKLDGKMDTLIKLVTELDKTIAVANARRGETCPIREELFYNLQEQKRAAVETTRAIYDTLETKVDRKDVSTTWGTLTKVAVVTTTFVSWGITLALALGWIG
jgi:hypothetical protein